MGRVALCLQPGGPVPRSMPLVWGLTLIGLSAASLPARGDFIDHFATVGDVGQMKVPRRGSAPVLVIPVIIDDEPFEAPFTTEQAFLAQLGQFYAPAASGGNSFAGYYGLASQGRYEPQPVVVAPVHFPTCPVLGGYSGCRIPRDGGLSSGDLRGAVDLLRDTIRYVDEILSCAKLGPGGGRRCTSGGGVLFTDVDRSGPAGMPDHFADGVILVSNGPFPGITLPVKWLAENPILRITLPPLPSFSYDGVTVGAVAISGRSNGRSVSQISIHEFGHLLGFADLYNERQSTTDLPYSVMGGWQYQSAAPLHDPFSRGMIGWANIQEVSGSQTYVLRPAREGGPILKLGTGDEYFLAEFRTGAPDLDADLSIPGGVLVERVRLSKLPAPDPGRFLRTLANCVNCTAWDPLVMIEEADGQYDLQANGPVDDASDLFLVSDAIGPSTDTSPRNASHPIFSTNRLSGAPTGTSLRVLELHSNYVVVAAEAPVLGDLCADLNRQLCRELSCTAGLCGDRVPPPSMDAGLADLGVGAPDVGPADTGVPDAGLALDAAEVADTGGADAATERDAGLSSPDADGFDDAVVSSDAASERADAAPLTDAGAARPDAGDSDAAPELDSGAGALERPAEGCGCQSTRAPKSEGLVLLCILAWLARRGSGVRPAHRRAGADRAAALPRPRSGARPS